MPEAAEQLPPENSGETAAGPPEGRRFQPGQSGNPGGRPKGLARRARELAGEDGETALMFLASVMAEPKEKTEHRILAARLLLERGWGKPPAFAPIEDEDPLDFSERESSELAARFEARLDELAARRAKKTP